MKYNDHYVYNQYATSGFKSKIKVSCRLCDNKEVCFVIDAMNKNQWNFTRLNFCYNHTDTEIKDYLYRHFDHYEANGMFEPYDQSLIIQYTNEALEIRLV